MFLVYCIMYVESRWVMEMQKYQEKIFEDIRYVNMEGVEYWEAKRANEMVIFKNTLPTSGRC